MARVVSRPLLVKGLEYDHVIILNPGNYSAQELYVALTRGSKSVTVISDSSVIPAAKIATHAQHRSNLQQPSRRSHLRSSSGAIDPMVVGYEAPRS